jgi:hypothetical protein
MQVATDIENQELYTNLKSRSYGSSILLIPEQTFCERNEFHIKFFMMIIFAIALILGGTALAVLINQDLQD